MAMGDHVEHVCYAEDSTGLRVRILRWTRLLDSQMNAEIAPKKFAVGEELLTEAGQPVIMDLREQSLITVMTSLGPRTLNVVS